MSDNLKDLIDKAENEERTRAELQKTIDKLMLENATLRKKLDEVKKQSKNIVNTELSIKQDSEEIVSLKKIISSQREQLVEKENHVGELEHQVIALNQELENISKPLPIPSESQVLFQTKQSLENVLEDYGRLESMNTELTNIINELEAKNYNLNKKLETIKSDDDTKTKLEDEVKRLKNNTIERSKENETLKQEINNLRAEISNQKDQKEKLGVLNSEVDKKNREIQLLKEALNKATNENKDLKKLETLIPDLKAEITKLKQQEAEIKEKDSILLAKTITAMTSREKVKVSQSPSIIPQTNKETIKHKIQEPILFSESDVEVKPVIMGTTKPKKQFENMNLPEPEKSVKDLIAEEINEGSSTEHIKRKWECPNCGNIDKSKIREIPDKSRIIYGSLYAKKYKCGLCASEWH